MPPIRRSKISSTGPPNNRASPITALKWSIFYADGSSYDSEAYKPEDLPGLGVIVIVQAHEDPQERPYLQHMTDYYIWLGDRWLGCDLFRFWQYTFIEKFGFNKVALAGQTISNKEYMKIRERAKDLRDKWYGLSLV